MRAILSSPGLKQPALVGTHDCRDHAQMLDLRVMDVHPSLQRQPLAAPYRSKPDGTRTRTSVPLFPLLL